MCLPSRCQRLSGPGRGRAAWPGRRAAPRCNAAGQAASRRPGPGTRRPRPASPNAPAPGRARRARSRRRGRARASSGRRPRPARAGARLTAGSRAGFAPAGNPGRRRVLLSYVPPLPPAGRAPSPGPADLVLAPFRGLRYAPDKVSGLAKVTSPPYDAIGQGSESRLLAADPHNVVRLILPHPGPGSGHSGPQAAAATLRGWISEGVLAADPRPALYAYEQSTGAAPVQVLQPGLIGMVRLRPPGDGIVLPHEAVMPRPGTGRRELVEATQANLEPIFLLYDGKESPRNNPSARPVTLPV